MEIEKLLRNLEIKYNEINHYIEAFTHMSFVHESKRNDISYERLEFLGDSILGQIIALYIFRNFENMEPGDMTLLRSRVVNKDFLYMVANELKFEKYIRTGKGEINGGISKSIYEDVFESLIGAIYLDLGYLEAKRIVETHICTRIKNINLLDLKDYKTKLQEFLQAEAGKSVEYKVIEIKETTPIKKITFKAKALFEGNVLGVGIGKSKKEAEKIAAKNAYERISK